MQNGGFFEHGKNNRILIRDALLLKIHNAGVASCLGVIYNASFSLCLFFRRRFLALLDHLLVDTALLILQRLVVAILNNGTLLEDDDTVCLLNGGETMGNNEGSDLATKLLFHLFDSALHFSLVSLVKCTSGLIENEHLGLLDEGTGEGKSLLLAT